MLTVAPGGQEVMHYLDYQCTNMHTTCSKLNTATFPNYTSLHCIFYIVFHYLNDFMFLHETATITRLHGDG